MSCVQKTIVQAALLLVATSALAAPDCADVAACYAEALKGSRALTISYHIQKNAFATPYVFLCTPPKKCESVPANPQDPAGVFEVPIPSVQFGAEGQGYSTWFDGPFEGSRSIGYSTLPDDFVLKFPSSTVSGFTIAATVAVASAGPEREIFSLISGAYYNAQDNLVFTAAWEEGRLVLERQRSKHQYSIRTPVTRDSPWDINSDVIRYGVYPFKLDTGGEPTPRLIELYFRFRTDGKVAVDMATINMEYPEILIGHIQDMGLYVHTYPVQDADPPWKSPEYPFLYGALPGNNVTQLVFFDHVLSDNEVLAFHAKNFYFGQHSDDRNRWHDVVPCNSGLWMNSNQTLQTVCGDRPGLGPSPGELEQMKGALPAVLVD